MRVRGYVATSDYLFASEGKHHQDLNRTLLAGDSTATSRYNVYSLMTDKLEVLQMLLAIFPDSEIDPAQPDPNETLTQLSSYLIECAKNNQTESFPQFFELVEFHIIYGNDDVRKMLLLGLLENLKNFASLQNLDYSVFEPWLGAETHIAWRWLEKRWQGSASLADSLRKRSDRT